MDEVIHSAPWRPGMKSSLVPAALFQRSWNTSPSQTGTPVCFAHFCRCLLTFLCLHVPAASRWTRTQKSHVSRFVQTVQSSRTRIENCWEAQLESWRRTVHTDCSAFCALELAVQTLRSSCEHPGGYTNRNRRYHWWCTGIRELEERMRRGTKVRPQHRWRRRWKRLMATFPPYQWNKLHYFRRALRSRRSSWTLDHLDHRRRLPPSVASIDEVTLFSTRSAIAAIVLDIRSFRSSPPARACRVAVAGSCHRRRLVACPFANDHWHRSACSCAWQPADKLEVKPCVCVRVYIRVCIGGVYYDKGVCVCVLGGVIWPHE